LLVGLALFLAFGTLHLLLRKKEAVPPQVLWVILFGGFPLAGLVIIGGFYTYVHPADPPHPTANQKPEPPAVAPPDTTGSAAPKTSGNVPGRLNVVFPPVRVTGSTYRVGDDSIPATQVAEALRDEVIKELTQTGHFSVLAPGSGGEVPRQGAGLKLDAQIQRLGYQRHARMTGADERPLVSYSGGAAVSYELVDVATGQVVGRDSLSTTVPSTEETFSPRAVNTEETLRKLELGLASKVAASIIAIDKH
jgi:hypothetical protein